MPFMHKFINQSTALSISIYLTTNEIKSNILFLLPRNAIFLLLHCFGLFRLPHICSAVKILFFARVQKVFERNGENHFSFKWLKFVPRRVAKDEMLRKRFIILCSSGGNWALYD